MTEDDIMARIADYAAACVAKARIPEGWEENATVRGFRWRRGRVLLEYSDDGVNQYIWTDGDGALPLKVLVAFCARAKEWKR